jgi:hypothetical protein
MPRRAIAEGGHPLKGPLSREKLSHCKKISISLQRYSSSLVRFPTKPSFTYAVISTLGYRCCFTAPVTHQDQGWSPAGSSPFRSQRTSEYWGQVLLLAFPLAAMPSCVLESKIQDLTPIALRSALALLHLVTVEYLKRGRQPPIICVKDYGGHNSQDSECRLSTNRLYATVTLSLLLHRQRRWKWRLNS